jgi:hypothetical protein
MVFSSPPFIRYPAQAVHPVAPFTVRRIFPTPVSSDFPSPVSSDYQVPWTCYFLQPHACMVNAKANRAYYLVRVRPIMHAPLQHATANTKTIMTNCVVHHLLHLPTSAGH